MNGLDWKGNLKDHPVLTPTAPGETGMNSLSAINYNASNLPAQ